MLPLKHLTATGSAPADLLCCFVVVLKQWKNGLCSSLWPVSTWPLDQMFSYLLRVHSLSHIINLDCWLISTTRNHPKKKKKKKEKKNPYKNKLFLCFTSSSGYYLISLFLFKTEFLTWHVPVSSCCSLWRAIHLELCLPSLKPLFSKSLMTLTLPNMVHACQVASVVSDSLQSYGL